MFDAIACSTGVIMWRFPCCCNNRVVRLFKMADDAESAGRLVSWNLQWDSHAWIPSGVVRQKIALKHCLNLIQLI